MSTNLKDNIKTIIQVYSTSYVNDIHDQHHGIGDFYRSTLGLYNLSKEHNFNLIVDLSLHPIHNYIECVEHDYSSLVKSNKYNINIILESEILEYIKNYNDNIIIMFGWIGIEVYKTPLSNDAQKFMKNIMIPNKLMQDYIDIKLLNIPFKPFNIIHYRLGDDEIFNNNTLNDYKMEYIINNLEKNDILLSDSKRLKESIKNNKIDVFMFDTSISHMGYSDRDIQDTLFEFFLIIKAAKVKSYSVYSWASGFTFAICFIYNIPIVSKTNIKIYNK